MKISPATQLVMKAAAAASVRKVLNLNPNLVLSPWGRGFEFKKTTKIGFKKFTASHS